MKKILLAAALAAVSLTDVKAESTPAGKGIYIAGLIGGGMINTSVEGAGNIYKIDSSKYALATEKSLTSGNGNAHFVWGYSHRFANDVTLGAEASFISPAVRFGYMASDKHHLVAAVRYAVLGNAVIKAQYELIKKNDASAKIDLDGMSGFGGSVAYEYFTASKNFFRVEVQAVYFSGTATLGTAPTAKAVVLPVIDGKGSAMEYTVLVGFGSQW